ncbi:MAG: LuxR C-terminal-related transcriptional regulator [Gammaproteobacteria bacterium]
MKEQLPSIQSLRKDYIDSNQEYDSRMLNCAAHMIIVIDDPKQLVQVGLEFMATELSACRADAGFATPTHQHYTPITEFRNHATEPPSITGLLLPNQHEAMQNIWSASSPLAINDVSTFDELKELKEIFLSASCKSMLIQKLVWEDKPIGITCIDHTVKTHQWNKDEINFMHTFCSTFLGPLAGISNYWFNPKLHSMFAKPTQSELIAIRLAAKGMTYKQIADQLNKSTRTIENQFRNARNRLNARNQIELVKKCEHWL